jgi:hypothetical protein
MVYKSEEKYSDCDILQIFIWMMDIEKKNIVVNRKALNLLLLKEGLGFF